MKQDPVSIEQGYFILTMMPSLRCSLNCPHCYLSKEQRRSDTLLPIESVRTMARKVSEFYRLRGVKTKKIICYWYGGEPTEVGQDYFLEAVKVLREEFRNEEGFFVKHSVLSSLIGVDESWYDLFLTHCDGELQTSFDGAMRGSAYIRKWERAVRNAVDRGLRMATISVVNNAIIGAGARETLDYLADLEVKETSWLPFMLNDQNAPVMYGRFAPSMKAYSEFMIELTRHWMDKAKKGETVPEIGQLRFILAQSERKSLANIAGQTLFLMPNGDFSLPDYRDDGREFLRPFGNILKESFEDVLSSRERRAYLRKQVMRNGNLDCMQCGDSDKCLMEFWKSNKEGDDCFGAREYVSWVMRHKKEIEPYIDGDVTLY